ncbi:MAG TPA: ChaN family lipoprotein [Desulfuromonadales bacterium]|nr:ChaN family lipoprotein [Desulfuromonadales bacterium]
MLTRFALFLAALGVVALSACAPKPVPCPTPLGNPQQPYAPPHPPKVGDILYLPTGTYVSRAQMLRVATDSRVVYVGETHDNPASHRLELEVLKALENRYPGKTALGMEMFSSDQQPLLDRWLAGQLTDEQFVRETGFERSWGWGYYRQILHFARKRHIPVVALNTPKRLEHELMHMPAAKLPEADRKALPQMNMNDPYQRALTEAVFSDHKAVKAHLSAFLRIQTLWDETMASNVARYLESPAGQKRHMLVMAGGNHIRFGFGIPRRVFRRIPVSYTLIGSKEIVIPADKQKELMNYKQPDFPMRPYDFLTFTVYEELPQKVRLGVYLDDAGGNVTVRGVVPGSPAQKAGMRAGDVIKGFDGKAVHNAFDLIWALRQKHPGDEATLAIEREGKKLGATAHFPAAARKPADK